VQHRGTCRRLLGQVPPPARVGSAGRAVAGTAPAQLPQSRRTAAATAPNGLLAVGRGNDQRCLMARCEPPADHGRWCAPAAAISSAAGRVLNRDH